MWLPDPNQLGQPTVFTSQSGSTATTNILGTAWVKPPGISWLAVRMFAAGGGGGGGGAQTGAFTTGGGGGGGPGTSMFFLMPASIVPDALYFSLGAGGAGGAGGVAGNGTAGGTGGSSRLHAPNGSVLLLIDGATGGLGGLTAGAGNGGQGTAAVISPWLLSGFFFQVLGGFAGGGGSGGVGQNATPDVTCPGAGGGGPRTTSERDGGAIATVLGYPALGGGTLTTTPASRVLYQRPFFHSAGGPGGVGTFGSTPGQAGASASWGGGGGGGGGCNNVASPVGGAGGRGGDGIAWLWSW